MRLIEEFSAPKRRSGCSEDGYVVGLRNAFVAVIDGATPKSSMLWSGKTSGRIAMETLRDTIEAMAPDTDFNSFVAAASAAFMNVYYAHGREHVVANEPWKRMAASVAIYSAARREVWMVGDCRFAINGKVYGHEKHIDTTLARVRAEANRYLLRHCGYSVSSLQRHDLGRELIFDDLRGQCLFQNPPLRSGENMCEYAYCVIDGFALPHGNNLPPDAQPLRVAVPQGSEIVLASDGYPRIMPTLRESEQWLAQVVSNDPLCIFTNVQTKGVGEGCESYDDRTYLRFQV